MTIFFTSDQHFGHANIIKYCNRPFTDVHEMNKALTEAWNSKVSDQDDVYFLGDFAMKSQVGIYFNNLNGKNIFVIPGSHDQWARKQQVIPRVTVLSKLEVVHLHSRPFTLCHYPLLSWYRRGRGGIHLYGHIHEREKMPFGIFHQDTFNVCVDQNSFAPIAIETILETVNDAARKRES